MGRSQKTLSWPPLWIAVGLLGMLSVALSSGFTPWGAALAGAVLPADLAADSAAAHLFIQRISPYGPGIRTAHMELTGLPFASTLPFFPHPPFSLIVGLPLAFVSFHVGAALWFGFTMALLFALAVLLHDSGPANADAPIAVGPMWLLLFAWPPVLYNLEKGQWSIFVAVLLTFAWRAIQRGDQRTGAAWAAAAASVKVFPVVLGAYFLLRSVRAVGWFVVVGVLLTAVPLLWIGFDSFPAFINESRQNLPYWETFPLVMFSIHGAIARALVGGQWALPFVHAPVTARLIEIAVLGVLFGVALWTTVEARRGRVEHSLALLAWLVLLPLLNPLALGHNGVVLALPLVVLARALTIAAQPWHRWAWVASLVLVSIPNQTVWRFAGLPAGAIEGLLIAALPAWGTLLLFALAVSVAHTAQRHDRVTEASGKIMTSPAASMAVHDSIARGELTRSKG